MTNIGKSHFGIWLAVFSLYLFLRFLWHFFLFPSFLSQKRVYFIFNCRVLLEWSLGNIEEKRGKWHFPFLFSSQLIWAFSFSIWHLDFPFSFILLQNYLVFSSALFLSFNRDQSSRAFFSWKRNPYISQKVNYVFE